MQAKIREGYGGIQKIKNEELKIKKVGIEIMIGIFRLHHCLIFIVYSSHKKAILLSQDGLSL
jgi:hypothetical protein